MDAELNPALWRDWLPVRCGREGSGASLDWCRFAGKRLTEPFFDETVRTLFREPFNRLFRPRTDLDRLAELIDRRTVVRPTGFIFHLSRCGSTLVSQMLAATAENIVVSEASTLDFALRDRTVSDARRIARLRALVAAYGRRRFDAERNLFVKFDSWNMLDVELVARAFPDVPKIFLYRQPVEIIVSHLDLPGAQTVRGLIPELLGAMSLEDSLRLSPERYAAHVLGRICEKACAAARAGLVRPVAYTELPAAVETDFGGYFRPQLSDAARAATAAAARYDAKSPERAFSPDAARKRRAASPSVVEAAAALVDPFFEELEQIRLQTSAESL